MGHITELVGVYHANGTWWGEITYWVGARMGTAHCALCDITHGTFRRKAGWTACADNLSVPFTTFHLDDRPTDVAAASAGATPCVLARVARSTSGTAGAHPASDLVLLVGPEDLEACTGDPEGLMGAIVEAARGHGLEIPGATQG